MCKHLVQSSWYLNAKQIHLITEWWYHSEELLTQQALGWNNFFWVQLFHEETRSNWNLFMRTTSRNRLWNSMIKPSKMQQESFTFSSESMIRISSKLRQDTKDLLNLPYKLQLKHFLFLKDNFLPLFNYFTDPLKKLSSHLHSNSWMVCASFTPRVSIAN